MTVATFHDFKLGDVVGTTFGVLFRNLIPFGFIALVLNAIPYLVVFAMPAGWYDGVESVETNGSDPSAALVFSVVWFLLYLLIAQFLTATLIYGAVQDLRGERANLSDCLKQALAVIAPVFGVAILATLAMGAGFLLLVIPGLIVAMMLYVAVPVAVIERPGVVQSLRRSMQLTKDNRWTLFWILFVVGLLQSLVNKIWEAIPPLGLAIDISGDVLVNAFFGALFAVLSAVAYLNLRYLKEGVGIDEIAAVFD